MKFPTRAEFMKWRKKNPTRGQRNDAIKCPLAQYLRDLGVENPWVGVRAVRYDSQYRRKQEILPTWAVEWIHDYDGVDFSD